MPSAPIKHTDAAPTVPNREKNSSEFKNSYYVRVSGKFRFAKYTAVVLLIVFLVFSFTFLRSDITLENLRYLLKFVSFTNTETSITANKINYASGDPNRLELFLGDLCTLSPSGYALYDSRGNQIMSESIKYSSPVLKLSSKYALCYDMNGNSFTILNTFAKLYEGTSEYPIYDADIADDGSFAIASSSREYRTTITLYNSDYKATTRINKNNHLMALEMKEDGSQVAILTTGVKDGEFYTIAELIAPMSNEVISACELTGIGYSIYYTDNGFVVITDEAICFLDESLELTHAYEHDYQLAMTDCSEKYLTSVYSYSVMGNRYLVRVYTDKGELIYEGEFDGKLIAVDSDESNDNVFVLTGVTLSRINLADRKVGSALIDVDAIDILPVDQDTVLICTKNYALTYELNNFEERYFQNSASRGINSNDQSTVAASNISADDEGIISADKDKTDKETA